VAVGGAGLAERPLDLQFLHPGQGLPQQVVEGHGMDQRRIQPGLQLVAMKLRDLPPGRLQFQLPAQTELRVNPPSSCAPVVHDHASESSV